MWGIYSAEYEDFMYWDDATLIFSEAEQAYEFLDSIATVNPTFHEEIIEANAMVIEFELSRGKVLDASNLRYNQDDETCEEILVERNTMYE